MFDWIILTLCATTFGIAFSLRLLLLRVVRARSERRGAAQIEQARRQADREIRHQQHKATQQVDQKLEKKRTRLKNRLARQISRTEELKEREERNQEDSLRIENILRELNNDRSSLGRQRKRILSQQSEAAEIDSQIKKELLEKIDQTPDQIQSQILAPLQEKLDEEMRRRVEHTMKSLEWEANRRVGRTIRTAIDRCQVSHFSEFRPAAVSLRRRDGKGVPLPGEEVNALLEETLEVGLTQEESKEWSVSSGDGVGREVAKRAIAETLRSRQGNVDLLRKKIQKQLKIMEKELLKTGRWAARQSKIKNPPNSVLECLGRLKFRTSYGQNILYHSIEVAHLTGLFAIELKMAPHLARQAGLLHDIGKALDHNQEGGHPELGGRLLRDAKMPEEVYLAAEGHHFDPEKQSRVTLLVSAADAISASRPGARRESFDLYIERLQRLESIAYEQRGVQTAYAIQAGRELRVLVDPKHIDDTAAHDISQSIVGRIESELQYPGPVKVTVIREKMVVEYAR
ncbi:MAG: HDIG domain-containing protein [Planctomycetota bacterium]|jgi:ribonuclease Y|nr:HDIG domain-containing protein [Planctomycetota bacterium]